MPFFKDLGGAAEKILGGPGGHEAYKTDKSFAVKTTANNGTKFTFEKTINNDGSTEATAKTEFKHSSGVNFKKIQIGTNGKTNFEAELAEAAKNTKLFVKIATLKEACNSKDGKKSECGALGFKFDNKDIAVESSVDILANDAPLIKASFAMGVPGVDGLTVGADAAFATSLDTWGPSPAGTDGKAGLQVNGATKPIDIVKSVALSYAGSDFDVTAVAAPAKKTLDLKYHQKLCSSTSVGAKVGVFGKGAKFEPSVTFGGSYALDKDTTVFSKIDSGESSVSLAFTQALNSNVTLTCATAVSVVNMNSSSFGAALEFSN